MSLDWDGISLYGVCTYRKILVGMYRNGREHSLNNFFAKNNNRIPICQEVSCRDQYLFLRQFARQIVMKNSLYYVYHFVRKYTVLDNIF